MDNGASNYRRFLDGDDNGLAEIIRLYNDGLTMYLNSFVNNLHVADELSEDTFVKLGVKKPHFSGKSSFKTWLYAIGRNVAINYVRKASKEANISLDECYEQSDGETSENNYLKDEQKILLHKAMSNLKTEYRQILWLYYFDEMSLREAAIVMNKSIHNIESLISRSRQALRSELRKEGFLYEDL